MSQFQFLDDDTAILMINQDTFTVARLRQLISQKLYQKLVQTPSNSNATLAYYLSDEALFLNDRAISISMQNIQFTFPTEGMDCKLLNLNTKEWQLGQLRIFADITIISYNVKINELKLEFAPDEPPLSDIETSLDEFRKQNLES